MLVLFSFKKNPKILSNYLKEYDAFSSSDNLENAEQINFEIFLFHMETFHYFLFWREYRKGQKTFLVLEIKKALFKNTVHSPFEEELFWKTLEKKIKEIQSEFETDISSWNIEIFSRFEENLIFKDREDMKELQEKLLFYLKKGDLHLKNEFTKKAMIDASKTVFSGIEYLFLFIETKEAKRIFFKICKNIPFSIFSIFLSEFKKFFSFKFSRS